MKHQNYAEFSLELHERLFKHRIPVNGTIEVTRRCPLECAHCYNNLSMGDQEARRSELTYEEHCRLLDEITEAGVCGSCTPEEKFLPGKTSWIFTPMPSRRGCSSACSPTGP